MASEWFYNVEGKKHGPLSSGQLQALAKSGTLKPTDKVWKEGMAQWVSASTIKGLFPSSVEAVTAKRPSVAASTAPGTDKGRPKARSAPEKSKKPRDSDREQESAEQRGGRGKAIALLAIAAVACVACLGGVIVAGAWYLNSGTPDKTLAENKEKPKGVQVAEEKQEPPSEQPKDKTAEKKEAPTGQIDEENKKEALSEIPSPQIAFQKSLPRPVLNVSFSPDGKQLACRRELLFNKGIVTTIATVTSWDASSGKEIWAFPPPTDIYTNYTALAYSPKGLVVRSLTNGISVVDANTGVLIKNYGGTTGTPVAFSLDGSMFTCRVFKKDFQTEPPLVVLEPLKGRTKIELTKSGYIEDASGKWYQNHNSTAFNPSGSLLVTGGHFATSVKQKAGERKIKPLLKVWNVATGDVKVDLSSKAGNKSIGCVTFSPDGKYIASTGSSGISLWDSETGDLLNTINATGETCCFHPSGKWIAGRSSGHDVKLWEPLTSKEVCHLKVPFLVYCLSLSGDGNKLAAGGGNFGLADPASVSGAICVWNLFPAKIKTPPDSTPLDPKEKTVVKGSLELRIKTTLDDALQFNRLLKAQKAYEEQENLIIEFGVNKAKWPAAVMAYAIRASVYDKSGRLLTTVTSKDDFTASSAVFNQWQTMLGRLKNLPSYKQDVGSFSPALLEGTDNRLSFPLSAAILREASIVEIGFVNVSRGGKIKF